MITRRCSEQRFFLRPDDETTRIVTYILARALRRYGVELHAVVVMSNHIHLVVTDVLGNLPEFLRYLDSQIARAMNRKLGRREAFWDNQRCNWVKLRAAEDVLKAIAYVHANPVKAGLTKRAAYWPGLSSWGQGHGSGALGRMGRYTVVRPKGFFRATEANSQREELQLTKPTLCDAMSNADYREAVAYYTREEEQQARAEVTYVMGAKRVCQQDPFSAPKGAAKARLPGMHPNVSGHLREVLLEGIREYRAFQQAYREAWECYRYDPTALFPAGTYWMRIYAHVNVAPDS